MRTRVKICGITRQQDALAAINAGVDAIGLVFYPPSPRAVTGLEAAAIIQGLPPFVTITGLFVDAGRDSVLQILDQVALDLLQFHGNESPADCSGYSRPVMKAIRMRDDINLRAVRDQFSQVSALLLDAYRKGVPGGTGESFDWDRIPDDLAAEIILAGGLAPENIEQAIRAVHPYGVDVSGGVEQDPAANSKSRIKSTAKIKAFMQGVRQANDPDK